MRRLCWAALLVCASMSLVAGGNIWEAAYLGSLAAACQVGRIGNIPLTARDLRVELESGQTGVNS